MKEFENFFKLTKGLFSGIESFMGEYVTDKYGEDFDDLFGKVNLPTGSSLVEVSIYSESKNTIVTYNIPFVEFLTICNNGVVYQLLEEKMELMFKKLDLVDFQVDVQVFHLDSI